MPSGITHMILSKVLLDRLFNKSREDKKYKIPLRILRSNPGAFMLGSVSPDLPYISLRGGDIADNLHYIKTNEVPQRGFAEAKTLVKNGKTDHAEALFCFNVGHYSHLVADGLMHPYVRDKVGDYNVAKTPHRVLEMKLDLIVARHFLNLAVNGTRFQNELDWISDCQFKNEIYTSFAKNISNVYACPVKAKDVEDWHSDMQTVFNVAEGVFPEWYRNLMGDLGFAFKNYNDIKLDMDNLTNLDMPIDAVEKQLTTNFTGKKDKVKFIDDVLEKYFDIFPDRVFCVYDIVFNDSVEDMQIPAINLDTGRRLTSTQLSDVPLFWSSI